MSPPVLVLGVRRSGTTLLRLILDRSSEIAIPDESHFLPQLAHRHPGTVDTDELLEDLRRLPALVRWDITADEVAPLLRPGMRTGEAIGAIFAAYAARQGKSRWGDKTPAYMRYLSLLDRLFPDAHFVHLIRDGRDAALSFLQLPDDAATRTWAHPVDAAGFACQWATEIRHARALGRRVGLTRYREIRYEELVLEPASVIAAVCHFAGLPYAETMLEPREAKIAERPHHGRVLEPPSKRRDWRTEMQGVDVRSFEKIAGDLLAELGYELADPSLAHTGARAKLELGWYRTRIASWRAAAYAKQRSPLWRRRHPRLT